MELRPQIQLADGSMFDILSPAENLPLLPLAMGCARTCRYAGQIEPVGRHYSVAEHSVLVGRYVAKQLESIERHESIEQRANVPNDLKMKIIRTAYLHDLQEGVLGDVPAPLKRLIPRYQALESKATDAIALRFDTFPLLPPIVLKADRRIILDERAAIGGPFDRAEWGFALEDEPLGVEIRFLDPAAALALFLDDLAKIGVTD